jgi:hypothetical protein
VVEGRDQRAAGAGQGLGGGCAGYTGPSAGPSWFSPEITCSRYVAPSFSAALGERTELTILASYLSIYGGSFSNDLVTLGGTRQARFNPLRRF